MIVRKLGMEGSPELTDILEREVIGANDRSAAVGYTPLTETERLVFAAVRYLNSPEFQKSFPEAGEDVKVMGYRHDRELTLNERLTSTIAAGRWRIHATAWPHTRSPCSLGNCRRDAVLPPMYR